MIASSATAKASIYLLGTRHEFQVGMWPSFESLVANTAKSYEVRLIAEEMSLEAVSNRGATQSICEMVARSMGVHHCYCDPDVSERAAIGIENISDNDIIVGAWLAGPFGTTEAEAAAIAAPRIRVNHGKRENEWLRRLQALNEFPTLFVCGADHVAYFAALVKSKGFAATLLCEEWRPGFGSGTRDPSHE